MLYFVENRFSAFKSADVSKDISQQFTAIGGILPHPAAGVGIGANGDDLTAQFLKPTEKAKGGQVITAAIHTAGIQLQSLALLNQDPQDLITDFPVIFDVKWFRIRVGFGFADEA